MAILPLLLALALLSTSAAQPGLPTTIEIRIPATVTLGPSGATTVTATLVYGYTAAGSVALAPTTVHVGVESATRGLVVTVDPTSVTIQPQVPLGATRGSGSVSVTIRISAPPGAGDGVVRFVASADANAPNAPSSSDAELRVFGTRAAPQPTQDASSSAAPPAPLATVGGSPSGSGIATLRELHAPPGPSPLVVPAFTAAGALVGVALRRRFR